MRTKFFFGMTVMLTTLVGITACDNEDDPVDNPGGIAVDKNLYGEWLLQGYGSDSNFTDAVFGHLILYEDGTLEGHIVNELKGNYTVNSHGEFAIKDCFYTMVYHLNQDYNFMEEQITEHNIKRFTLSDNELRLFYSSDEYLKFIKWNDDISKSVYPIPIDEEHFPDSVFRAKTQRVRNRCVHRLETIK